MDYSIVLLALNEVENLKSLLPHIHEEMSKMPLAYEVLVIDGHSSDGTREICEQYNAKFILQEKSGYADAFRCAVEHAKGRFLLNLDADHSHSPNFFSDLIYIAQSDTYDLVIASRYVVGAKYHMSVIRSLLSRLLSLICRLFIGLRTLDCSSGFRIYRLEALQTLSLHDKDFSILLSILTQFEKQGRRIIEVPFEYFERRHGRSHVEYLRFAISYCNSLIRCRKIMKRKQ